MIKRRLNWLLTGWVALWLATAGLLVVLMPDAVRYAECWRTFYWDAHHIHDLLAGEGLGTLVSDFLTQFLATRCSAALMIGGLYATACLVIVALAGRWLQGRRLGIVAAVTVLGLGGVTAWWTMGKSSVRGTEGRWRSEMCLVHEQRWDNVLRLTDGRRLSNQLELNLRNLALAETGGLAKQFKAQPNADINHLVVLKIGSPEVAAMLSDIYWSMGEVSMSQYYAFEANEKMGNLSPRLLQRLALTNIVYGEYRVAEKYLKWLDKTLFYHKWAQHCRTLLRDEAVNNDPVLSLKRRCIPRENCFPSARSIPYDLEQLLKQCPEHRSSREYLEAIQSHSDATRPLPQ